MMTYAIIGAVAVVVTMLAIFGLWYANYLGRKQGASSASGEVSQADADAQRKAGSVLQEYRTDEDTEGRLNKGTF